MATQGPIERAGGRETIVIATGNRGKVVELKALLQGLKLDVVAVGEVLSAPPEVIEDGATFEANALKKARAVAAATGLLSVADDSGLEVDALGGRPGVFSARFAHAHATDDENKAALLAALADVDERTILTARFRCVLALIDPSAADEAPAIASGVCEGTIVRSARGTGGFGYDPLFVPAAPLAPGGGLRTLAEMAPDEKNALSHRARAIAALRPSIVRALEARGRGARPT